MYSLYSVPSDSVHRPLIMKLPRLPRTSAVAITPSVRPATFADRSTMVVRNTADACVRLGEPSRSAYGYGSGIAVTPAPAHIAQTVTVGLMVVLPVLVQVTRHVRSLSG
jgi:hypothetical protein